MDANGNEILEIGTWVKFKEHNRYGRISEILYKPPYYYQNIYKEDSYNTDRTHTVTHTDITRGFTWKTGAVIYVVDRVTKRNGIDVILENRWYSEEVEEYDPSPRRIQLWALAKMRQ